MPELLLSHKFHHLLDGDVVVQAVGGETVRPPILGVGVLVVLDLATLLENHFKKSLILFPFLVQFDTNQYQNTDIFLFVPDIT